MSKRGGGKGVGGKKKERQKKKHAKCARRITKMIGGFNVMCVKVGIMYRVLTWTTVSLRF